MCLFPSNSNFTYTDFQPAPYDAYPYDVITVLDSVKSLFSKYFNSIDELQVPIINNAPGVNHPYTVLETSTIYLSVDATDEHGNPACYWCQFIYQFSHELCHLIISKQVVQPMRWFEETICELASHFFLIESAKTWSVNPPCPHWRNYALSILDYELKQQNTGFPSAISDLFDTSSNLICSLEKDEYQREFNCAVATKLLPYFIDSPDLWKIVYYLPKLPAQNTFSHNLHLLQELSNQPIEKIMLFLAKSKT